MGLIRVSATLAIDEAEIAERFVHASGPGGQNVNKVATAVQLRFSVRGSPSLPEAVRGRLEKLSGRRLTQDGVLVLEARRHRTQQGNRDEARARLLDLIRRAAIPPVRRRATAPTAASRQRRLVAKASRAKIKQARTRPRDDGA